MRGVVIGVAGLSRPLAPRPAPHAVVLARPRRPPALGPHVAEPERLFIRVVIVALLERSLSKSSLAELLPGVTRHAGSLSMSPARITPPAHLDQFN
jgi:hypothetical protein